MPGGIVQLVLRHVLIALEAKATPQLLTRSSHDPDAVMRVDQLIILVPEETVPEELRPLPIEDMDVSDQLPEVARHMIVSSVRDDRRLLMEEGVKLLQVEPAREDPLLLRFAPREPQIGHHLILRHAAIGDEGDHILSDRGVAQAVDGPTRQIRLTPLTSGHQEG